jgi:hypothetical protein
MRPDRETIQKAYIRLCRDSRFRCDMIQAAHLTGRVLRVCPIDVWLALGFDNMERIANGTHPCLEMERYAT